MLRIDFKKNELKLKRELYINVKDSNYKIFAIKGNILVNITALICEILEKDFNSQSVYYEGFDFGLSVDALMQRLNIELNTNLRCYLL